MKAPSLFPAIDVSLSTAQVTHLERMLNPCSTYSVGFGVFKDKNGSISYIGTLCYVKDGKPATKFIRERIVRGNGGSVIRNNRKT